MEIGFCLVRSFLSHRSDDIILSVFMWTWCARCFFPFQTRSYSLVLCRQFRTCCLTTWTKIFPNMIFSFVAWWWQANQNSAFDFKRRDRTSEIVLQWTWSTSVHFSALFLRVHRKYIEHQSSQEMKKKKPARHYSLMRKVYRWKRSLIEKCQTRAE